MKYKIRTSNRRKNIVGLVLLLLILLILLTLSVGFISIKVQTKNKELQGLQEMLDRAKQEKDSLQVEFNELQEVKVTLEKEVSQLKEEIQILKKENTQLVGEGKDKNGENQKVAYLTFDDGPSVNTPKILDFLKVNNLEATFFVLGKENEASLYKRIVDEGHTLAVHSNTHNYKEIYKDVDSFMADINALSSLIEEATGVKPNIMRFPGGSNNSISKKYGGNTIMDKIIPTVEAAGYSYFDWNVDSRDAAKSKQDKQVIIDSVLKGAELVTNNEGEANAVILMHDAAAKTTTVEALPAIVEGLKKQGFVFRKLTSESQPIHFK